MKTDRHSFEEKVLATIRRYGMIRPGMAVAAGLSGGADSVCLLRCLHSLREELKISEIRAVHVHHGIRGAEADRDEAFCRAFARSLGIPCDVFHRDVPAMAAEKKLSEEETGRLVRREIFEQAAASLEGQESAGPRPVRIATAHHMDDTAETVLMNLSRGTGLSGIAGIRPVSGIYIRPLLRQTKEEILAYLADTGTEYCEDSTNASADYTRNRVRHHILPLLSEEVNSRASAHIAEAAYLAGEALDFMEREAAVRAERSGYVCRGSAGPAYFLREEAFSAEQGALTGYMIRYAVRRTGASLKDISLEHIRGIEALANKTEGKYIMLPSGIAVYRDRAGILLFRTAAGENAPEDVKGAALRILAAGGEDAPHGMGNPAITLEKTAEFPYPVPENTYTKWIDSAIIANELRVRTRQPGDYIVIHENGWRKTVSDYMTDVKMPRALRDTLPLVADGAEIVWIPGWRLNMRYKITGNTKTAVRMDASPCSAESGK